MIRFLAIVASLLLMAELSSAASCGGFQYSLSSNGRCYFIIGDKEETGYYNQAKYGCMMHKGNMAIIQSDEENAAVFSLIKQYKVKAAFGMVKKNDEWANVNSSIPVYKLNFDPEDNGSGKYGILDWENSQEKWNSKNSNRVGKVLCEKKDDPAATTAAAALQKCGGIWRSLEKNGRCYGILGESYLRVSFDDARSKCQAAGADLVKIESDNENNDVFDVMKAYGVNTCYLGARKVDGEWVNADGSPLSKDFFKPNKSSGKLAYMIYMKKTADRQTTRYWYSNSGNKMYRYMCEKAIA